MRKKIARLVKQFKPEIYELRLKIDDNKLSYTGSVKIVGNKVGAPNKRLIFHQSDLNINSAKVTYHSKTDLVGLKVDRINKQQSLNEVRIHFGQLIYPGKYTVEIEFSGKITSSMKGIYPCYYKESKKEKHLIATQFESHHAREVFPCIDEPEAKAIFNLTLDTPIVKTVISNTEVIKQKKLANRLITSFEPTPKMSSYLLAFVYGDLAYLESKSEGGVLVRTYATPENIPHTKFALEVMAKALDFFSGYYGVDYPLPKCDLVALPDFASGAMENWGIVTFREQTLVVDKENSSQAIKQYVAMVITHELAHQWFGNLVTMSWWNDLWLNESFASWMSYLALDHLFPKWKVWAQFVVEEQEQALSVDALENTHPIEVPINHPDEIYSIFDAISYEKGASVINMLNAYLTPEVFQKGINLYLKKHAYSNTVTNDLWAALEEASKSDVSQFMNAWTSLSGFPMIKVDYQGTKVKINQTRFYINPSAKKQLELWPVPVSVKDNEIRLFNKPQIVVEPDTLAGSGIINSERMGFYRAAYSSKYLDRLIKSGIDKLSPLNRLALLSDQIEAAKAGYISTIGPLTLLSEYEKESEMVVWDVIASFFNSLRNTLRDNELRESIKPFIRHFTKLQLNRLGFKPKAGESYFDSLLRPNILGLAAVADEETVINYINKTYKKADIPPDFRRFVYPTIARLGGEKEYKELLDLYNKTSSPEQKLNLTLALCNFEDPKLINKTLAFIKTDKVRPQDVFYWISYCFANFYGRDLTWQWFKDNWQWLEDNFQSDLSFHRVPNIVARNYCEPKDLKMYLDFFNKHRLPSLERSIKQGAESIEWHSEWRKRDLKVIKNFFLKTKA